MGRWKKDETWSMKAIKTDEVLELFRKYKEKVKSKPILVHDFKGKDAESVRIEKERPLTIEGFINYVEDERDINIEHYIYPAESQKADYKEYLGIFARIKREIRDDQIVWGMSGIYNPSITARLNWLVEKQETKQSWASEDAKAEAIKKLWEKIEDATGEELNSAIQDLLNIK